MANHIFLRITKANAPACRVWNLRIEVSLVLGAWILDVVPVVSSWRLVGPCGRHLISSHERRKTRRGSKGAPDQSRQAEVRHVRRDRRRPGGGALVLPG